MKVRMNQDWNFYKAGEIAEVFEPLARNWIQSGVASAIVDPRSLETERADADDQRVERAVVTERRKAARKE